MADLSAVNANYFTIASETFTDNLSSSIAALAATVPITNLSEYTNGDIVVLTVDPGTVNEATFIGVKNGSQVQSCIWTEGNTAVGHSNGATVIDYDSATHHNAMVKGLLLLFNQDGTLKDTPIRTALGLSAAASNGWNVFPYTCSVTSGYNQGDHLYNITVANQDVRSLISEGMYFKMDRSVAALTQCFDAESTSSQFAQRASGSVTGTLSTITDDLTMEGWAKPESFGAADAFLWSKVGTAGTNGVRLGHDYTGRIFMDGFVSGGNFKQWRTRVAIQQGIWTHIAASMDLSGSSGIIYINGFSVAVDLTTGGACTAFTNTGNVFLGAQVGGSYFDGKLSDWRVWNIVRTQTQIRDNMNNILTGSETNLIGYWKCNGDFNDSTSSANHLTGSGGAVATTLDHPHSTTQYMKVAAVSYSAPNSTIQVLANENHCIPNLTLNSPYYSDGAQPYGAPVEQNRLRSKWATNSVTFTPTNASVDLATNGLVVMMTVPRACRAEVFVTEGVGATADFEFRPQIRLGGAIVDTFDVMTPAASLSSAGGRAFVRSFKKTIELQAGTNFISAGLELISGAGYNFAQQGGYLEVNVPGNIAVR